MQNNLDQLAESIVRHWAENFDHFGKMEEREIVPLGKEMNFKEVFRYILFNHAYSCEFILLKFFSRWNNYSLGDWHEILNWLVLSPQKPFFPLDVFLIYFYQYMQIDLLQTVAASQDIDREFKKTILGDYIERPGRLYISNEERLDRLRDYNLTANNLEKVQKRLLKEGATIAEPIDYHSHAYQKYGIELFAVQGPVPNSWTWAKSL